MPKSLWGDLSNLEIVSTPKSLLDEQASILTEATKGVLVGKVVDRSSSGTFAYEFNVEVPALNHYMYTLFVAYHSIELYPVRVVSSKPPIDEKCADANELEAILASILSSEDIKRILSRLLSQIS